MSTKGEIIFSYMIIEDVNYVRSRSNSGAEFHWDHGMRSNNVKNKHRYLVKLTITRPPTNSVTRTMNSHGERKVVSHMSTLHMRQDNNINSRRVHQYELYNIQPT